MCEPPQNVLCRLQVIHIPGASRVIHGDGIAFGRSNGKGGGNACCVRGCRTYQDPSMATFVRNTQAP